MKSLSQKKTLQPRVFLPQRNLFLATKNIYSSLYSAAAVAIGTARLSAVDFSGLVMVDKPKKGGWEDNDFIGFVFSFQDTHNFYVVYGSKQGSGQGPWKIVRVASTDLTKLELGIK